MAHWYFSVFFLIVMVISHIIFGTANMKVISTVFLRLRPGLREEWLQSMFPSAPGMTQQPVALQLAGYMSKEEAEVIFVMVSFLTQSH